MSIARFTMVALGVAAAAARHPVVRAGVSSVVNNPAARDAAVGAVRRTAFSAGVIARKIIPRQLVR